MSDATFTYPDELEIQPLAGPLSASVSVPGSKSITNRALVLAALASRGGSCELIGALRSEDTEVMIDGLRQLGFRIETVWADETVRVGANESGRIIPTNRADLFVANSGTTMRFLTAMVSLGEGLYRLDGVPRMRERPIRDLLDALTQLGVNARSEAGNGSPPVVIESHGWRNSEATIPADVSSQFLSALMMAAPYSNRDTVRIGVGETVVSRPYLDMTAAMLRDWGASIDYQVASPIITVPGKQRAYRPHYRIEPDASAASYFFAAAAVLGGRVTVLGLPENGLQGDVGFVDVLASMGCRVERCSSGITVHGRPLRGVDVDMNAISDTVMTLGAVACFAEGPTTIRNVGHIRHKETDRISALATELRKVGAGVEEFADGLRITSAPLRGAAIDTYNDHRMAMSLALVGLRVPGVVIRNPGCVAKTYPGFWQDLARLRG
jgi:3-phosphoshikimate 1-carboxyvinyltransferase